jgi:hypothetical protein
MDRLPLAGACAAARPVRNGPPGTVIVDPAPGRARVAARSGRRQDGVVTARDEPAAIGREAGDAVRTETCRFRAFAFLFALATVLYHRWTWFPAGPESIPLAAAFLVLLRPSSRRRFLLFAVIQTGFAFADLPGANTNRTLHVFLTATIVGGWLLAAARSRALPSAAAWLRAFEPALRLQLIVIYAWAFWHKLNVDFFDVDKSCGVELFRRVCERVPLIETPTAPWALHAAVWATVVVEGLLPVLLVPRRTRNVALVLGVGLHFVCGLSMFYDFSMTMLALLFLFAPGDLARALSETPALDLRARLGLGERAWTALVTAVAVAGILVSRAVVTTMYNVFALAWWLLPIGFAIAGWTMLRRRLAQPPARELLRVDPRMALFPALVLLNGACPYLGSKTETSFAMYSNLRTEGGVTNHLLLPRPLGLFGYQTDLVTIERSSDPELEELAREGLPVPFYVLRKRVWEAASAGATGIEVSYARGGRPFATSAAEREPDLNEAPSWFERKFLRFRKILPMDANVCAH